EADILGHTMTYRLGMPGRHWVMNSLAVLASVVLLGGDLKQAADALAGLTPLRGRGARHRIPVPGGAFVLIDDSYNASPPSMRAALATLAVHPVEAGGRRIAVLGDMLELGVEAPALHRALAFEIEAAGIDRVFAAGLNMEHLWQALPPARRGAFAPSAAELAPLVLEAVRPGDAVLVKGSFGSRMGLVVEALLSREARVQAASA
ncbi:MAG TPA: cyanophycin synthetase, partial [Phenylobacterium sp.]